MYRLKKLIHQIGVALAGLFAGLLPDRIPVTFVGPAASRGLCQSMAQAGVRRVLIVTDAVLVELGLVGRIQAMLEDAGVAVATFSGVAPDPTFDQVEAGLVQLREQDCDAILAIGGGSSMDAAKVIAAMATNPVPLAKLEGMFKVRVAPLDLYAIPTTAGTGSEVTVVAVVSDPTSHAKKFIIDPKLLPRMAALDPELMLGLPQAITAVTGMDALTHAVESYIARTATPITRDYSRTAVRLVFGQLPRAYTEGQDVDARMGMALASYYGGLAFTRTSVGYVHAIAHTLGACYGTPHGHANAIVLPHILEISKHAAEGPLAELADLIEVGSGSTAERAQAFIDAVRRLMDEIQIAPTLDSLRREDVPAIAKQALAEAHLNYPVPRYLSQSECEEVVSRLLPSQAA